MPFSVSQNLHNLSIFDITLIYFLFTNIQATYVPQTFSAKKSSKKFKFKCFGNKPALSKDEGFMNPRFQKGLLDSIRLQNFTNNEWQKYYYNSGAILTTEECCEVDSKSCGLLKKGQTIFKIIWIFGHVELKSRLLLLQILLTDEDVLVMFQN